MGYMQGMPPQGQQQQLAPPPPIMDQSIQIEDEPPNKKLRSEDHLKPESQFLAMHKVYCFIYSFKLIIKKKYLFSTSGASYFASNNSIGTR